MEIRKEDFLLCIFREICDGCTGVRLDSRYFIVKRTDQGWHNFSVECFLEAIWHVICDLTNTVEGCVSDFGVRMLQMLKQDRNHASNFGGIIHILSYLRECHDSGMLISPVSIISNSVLHKLTNERKHYLITNSSNKSVD